MMFPECIGCRCPAYGNCEGWYEGEVECLENGGAETCLIYKQPAFTDSGYVWAPYIPLQMDSAMDDVVSAYRARQMEAIYNAFRLPPHVIGIDTGDD